MTKIFTPEEREKFKYIHHLNGRPDSDFGYLFDLLEKSLIDPFSLPVANILDEIGIVQSPATLIEIFKYKNNKEDTLTEVLKWYIGEIIKTELKDVSYVDKDGNVTTIKAPTFVHKTLF